MRKYILCALVIVQFAPYIFTNSWFPDPKGLSGDIATDISLFVATLLVLLATILGKQHPKLYLVATASAFAPVFLYKYGAFDGGRLSLTEVVLYLTVPVIIGSLLFTKWFNERSDMWALRVASTKEDDGQSH